jgi:hypothetical protein
MFIVDRNIINKLSKASLGLINKSRICVDFDFFLDHFTISIYYSLKSILLTKYIKFSSQ